jgi:hypothetical protein
VVLLYVLAATVAAAQRALGGHAHWTYPDFREAFYHLLHHQNLYVHYATQGYDLYKYSPTFALLFAPFALPPFAVGLLLWDLCNALALYVALEQLLPRRRAVLAALLLAAEVFAAVQASQSDALVAALIIFAFVALERGRPARAAVAIGLGATIKLFPLAALSFAIPRGGRLRFALFVVGAGVVLVALPLLVIPPRELAWQYQAWLDVARQDMLYRGRSVMRLIALFAPGGWPNWPVQLAGTLLLLLPLALRRERWGDARFRLVYLCSLLVYVVIFNHKAERSSFILAATGIVIWWVTGPRTLWRTALMLLSIVGLKEVPCVLAWIAMQGELLARAPLRIDVAPGSSEPSEMPDQKPAPAPLPVTRGRAPAGSSPS